jgi:transposase
MREKKAKYVMLKNSDNHTDKQRAKFMEINQANLLTARAWKMKANFLELFEKETIDEASVFFDNWYENVIKSNIQPMKRIAKTLKNYKTGIINIVKYKLTNAKAERFNGSIQKLNAIAHGYRNFANLRVAILFYNGNLDLFSHK